MKKTKKGFTLVELVIVVAVMAVLVAVAIPTVGAITQSAKDSVAESNAQTIESMIKLEEAELSESNGVISATAIASALNDAKLGITVGTFYYNTNTGICATTSAATGEVGSGTLYTITFTGGTASAS